MCIYTVLFLKKAKKNAQFLKQLDVYLVIPFYIDAVHNFYISMFNNENCQDSFP